MKFLLLVLIFLPRALFAQLETLAPAEPVLVFGGKEQSVQIIFKNPTEKMLASVLRTRLFQASSATLMPIGEWKVWKTLETLPGQTLIENFAANFPAVREMTEFRLRVSEGEKQIADLEIRVVPADLLKQLSALAGKTPIDVFDPDNQLKPLLKKQNVEFQDLENDAVFDGFHGVLAVIGPFLSTNSLPLDLRDRVIKKLKETKKPIGMVWLQPLGSASEQLFSAYFVQQGESNVFVVPGKAVRNLVESPQSQLNLIRAATLALQPDLFQLP
jgi:hypothetical protein